MSSGFSAVDLSKLAAPDLVETLDFEAVFAEMLADLQARAPDFSALIESDPAYKILEVAAYRELLLRQRVNDSARSVMLSYAAGADLDQIAANFGISRLVVDPGDAEALPPIPPTFEADADLRRRVQLVPEGYTTAGSIGSYVFHALGADADVKDVEVSSPAPGEVVVHVLSRTGNGAASGALLSTVSDAVSADDVRPLCDGVTVQSAAVTSYSVEAELTVYSGPDSAVVLATAIASAEQFVAENHALGRDITRSGLFAALHVAGVQNVALTSPAADLVMDTGEAAFCSGVTVTVGGVDV
jgi:phage-related baseplate assembly protein